MSISARLAPKTLHALTRYCKSHGLTKTQAIERGIALLLREPRNDKHAAFVSFERLRENLPQEEAHRHEQRSSNPLKRHLDEKYPA